MAAKTTYWTSPKQLHIFGKGDVVAGELLTDSEAMKRFGEIPKGCKKVQMAASDTFKSFGVRFPRPAKAKTCSKAPKTTPKRKNPARSPAGASEHKGYVWLVELWLAQQRGTEMETDIGICTSPREAQLVMAEAALQYCRTSSLTIQQKAPGAPMVAQPKPWCRITATRYPLNQFVG